MGNLNNQVLEIQDSVTIGPKPANKEMSLVFLVLVSVCMPVLSSRFFLGIRFFIFSNQEENENPGVSVNILLEKHNTGEGLIWDTGSRRLRG